MPGTALLVVDLQLGLFDGERPVFDGTGLLERVRDLTARARAADVPVVYVQDDDVAAVGSAAWELHPELAADPGAPRVRKAYADAFHHTDLHERLQALGSTRLVVSGCTTDACIDMTCRRAVSLGYDVVLAADAHSTRDNSFLTAARSIEYYNRILDGFGAEDGFGNGEHEVLVQNCAEITLP